MPASIPPWINPALAILSFVAFAQLVALLAFFGLLRDARHELERQDRSLSSRLSEAEERASQAEARASRAHELLQNTTGKLEEVTSTYLPITKVTIPINKTGLEACHDQGLRCLGVRARRSFKDGSPIGYGHISCAARIGTNSSCDNGYAIPMDFMAAAAKRGSYRDDYYTEWCVDRTGYDYAYCITP